jgi:hypothetical protein
VDAKLVGEHLARLGGAWQQHPRALAGTPREQPLEHPLADVFLWHEVRPDATRLDQASRCRADRGNAKTREVLPDELRVHGARVDVVPAYRTVPGDGDPSVLARLRAGDVDAVTFTSSSTVKNFVRLTEGVDLGTVVVACIGPVTAQTAGELGLTVAVEPEEYTIPALVEALGAYFAET